MSFKAKDLHFDNSQPAFLQRLRGQMQGEDSARHERPIPRNKRMKQDDEDDAPTYVLEDTNQSMTKEEYEAFVTKKDSNEDGKTEQEDVTRMSTKDAETKSKDRITEIGANAKKRKAAKIISDEQQDDKDQSKNGEKANVKTVKKPKKKAKVVKLTFGDEEEG
ncbi:hypothetical protein BU25DRAFT_36789 [Macroventuria anomochaeta]|uniref:Uncharacterized protein n=1 Tax=Macroventuria anomochaeta TaxID=301207 RepID=A0ACB6S3C5_9PLEO|nr:uncharacterized protein BU25DRAFT_36789 [Macroventuria anomochaeta]KAF2628472.1 hypothetical protein BU25DRAFT_36789 [Macroventuria anomochaeta]